MVQALKALNSKEVKEIYELLEKQFGLKKKLDVVFFLSEKKEKLYIFTRDLEKIDLKNIRVDAMGLYFASYYKGEMRLSIEGTQLIGPYCTKNIIELNKKEMQTWMLGEKLTITELEKMPEAQTGFVILKYNNDFLGCGKMQENTILNYIPKTRFVHALYD